ncbi:hypothetical protein TVAG_409830 [Trichomonas vaginalis G3]|uniref:Uncharacterized protein n=1 Tax=Trichomonas vaginalis (strain ATCC PRA-98 / G3) TaxID=412133 RepID=A2F8E3_TRIV3|nr:hypothetical protein TVAGG3_0365450 [Trichomonas vaginalis G3]EAX98845.1 hypothetical protein TVAG_409830 [Trichomonas vaginalis G3]KAI5532233.1 hypothetical protein TVAGG3_0365450 [Trichomonas vaginalis G3]|eukprot:XP_001311775.1 hypothetical protein [Trichomonas vaginalis G3]
MLFVFSSLSLSYPSHSRTRRGVYLPRWSEEEKNCPYGGLSAGWCEFHRCGTPIGVVLAMKRNLTKNGHPRPWDPSHEAGFPRFFQEENKWEFPIDPIAPPRPWRTGWSEEEKNCPYSGLTGAHHPFGTPIGWLIMRRRNLTKNGFPRFFQEERYLRPTNVVCRPDRFGQPVCDIHEENKWEIPFDPTRGSKPWRIGWSEEEKNCPSGEIAYGWGEAHGFIPRPHPRVIKRIPRTTNVECWPDEYGMPMCRPNEENKWEIPFDPTRGSKPWRIGWSEEEKNCPSGEIAYGWGEAHGFIPRPHPHIIRLRPRTTNLLEPIR